MDSNLLQPPSSSAANTNGPDLPSLTDRQASTTSEASVSVAEIGPDSPNNAVTVMIGINEAAPNSSRKHESDGLSVESRPLLPEALDHLPVTLLLMSTSIIFFVLPWALASTKGIYAGGTPSEANFFRQRDIIRIIDPVVTLPLIFLVFAAAPQSRLKLYAWIAFFISAAIYVQGHGMHLMANTLAGAVKTVITTSPNSVVDYPMISDVYEYAKETWEHEIAHYMYAFGAVLLSFCHVYAHWHNKHSELIGWRLAAFLTGSFVYGIMIASVAIEFPSGTIVGLIFLILYGLPLNIYLYRQGDLLARGRRMVLQYYALSYILALIIVIAWIAAVGFKTRVQAGF